MLLFFLGMILIILGFMIILLPSRSKEDIENLHQNEINQDHPAIAEDKAMVRGGAIIMLGPIPIVIGSDSKMALVLILLTIAIMLLWLVIKNT